MASEFKIGATEGGMTTLDALTVPLPDPKSPYLPYSRKVMKGNGEEIGVGAPVVQWEFPLLTNEQYLQLRTFSGNVFIRTLIDDQTYVVFSCYMSFPLEAQKRWFGHRQNYVVTFRNLVVVP